jgi:hypothetical protein
VADPVKEMIHCNASKVRSDRIKELRNWVRSLGVDPANVRTEFAIMIGESSYELHLSEFVRNKGGGHIVNHAHNETVSKPLIIDLGQTETWPEWLNEYRCHCCTPVAVQTYFHSPKPVSSNP